MRLIDLEDEMLKKNLLAWSFEGGLSAKQAIRLFMNQPTVEAIPVEWIEKKIEELKDTDDYVGFAPIHVHEIYEHVLEIWRRENENSNKRKKDNINEKNPNN